MNIIETVQKNLGYNTLEKIDPNTQETPGRPPVSATIPGTWKHFAQ